LQTSRYKTSVLCTDIANKRMHPAINTIAISETELVDGLSHHAGEEFLHVLSGELVFLSEFYEPLRLMAGDSLYFDSSMGHAYASGDGNPAVILVVATTEPATA
jgi:quercetin dioxygenase-like cupin family protein